MFVLPLVVVRVKEKNKCFIWIKWSKSLLLFNLVSFDTVHIHYFDCHSLFFIQLVLSFIVWGDEAWVLWKKKKIYIYIYIEVATSHVYNYFFIYIYLLVNKYNILRNIKWNDYIEMLDNFLEYKILMSSFAFFFFCLNKILLPTKEKYNNHSFQASHTYLFY